MVLAIICFLVYGYFEYSERQAVRKLEELQNRTLKKVVLTWLLHHNTLVQDLNTQNGKMVFNYLHYKDLLPFLSFGTHFSNGRAKSRKIKTESSLCIVSIKE